MHIIIGLITAIAGLIWALNSLQRAGVDLNAFNPLAWLRRRRWKNKLGVKPQHNLTNSIDAAALLVVSVVKSSGEVTRESKMEILALFENEFGIKRNKSIELFSASSYLLKDTVDISAEVKAVLAPSQSSFTDGHIHKLIEMLNKVASFEGKPSEQQVAIINAVKKVFEHTQAQDNTW